MENKEEKYIIPLGVWMFSCLVFSPVTCTVFLLHRNPMAAADRTGTGRGSHSSGNVRGTRGRGNADTDTFHQDVLDAYIHTAPRNLHNGQGDGQAIEVDDGRSTLVGGGAHHVVQPTRSRAESVLIQLRQAAMQANQTQLRELVDQMEVSRRSSVSSQHSVGIAYSV